MNAKDFLSFVWPDAPHYLIAYLNPAGNGFVQRVISTIEAAVQQAEKWSNEKKEVYFAVGSLKSEQVTGADGKVHRRTFSNIDRLKALIADIDTGTNKPYENKEKALQALKQFCKLSGFPKPSLIVSSGGGLHVYWVMDRPVPAHSWAIVAGKLKQLFAENGLMVDGSRTADATSVLRVVGTNNYKRATPRPVEVLMQGPTYKPSTLRDAISAKVGTIVTATAPDVGASNMDRYADVAVDFRRLLANCPQVQFAALNQAATPEPIWYAVLQLVRFTTNPIKAAHIVSQEHPTYLKAETEQRMQRLIAGGYGPTTCVRFQDPLTNPQHGLCSTCGSFGKIASPAQLAPTATSAPPPVMEVTDEEGNVERIEIPNPPEPFVRTPSGRIVVKQYNADGDEIAPMVVSPYDMYPLRGAENEHTGHEHSWWRIKLPVEGWRNVELQPGDLVDHRKLAPVLMGKGVYLQQEELKLAVRFMTAYLKQLRETEQAERTFSRIGWRENCSLFVLGDTAYYPNGRTDTHKPSSEVEVAFRGGMIREGALDEWKRIIQFYNTPGYEGHRFFLYASFGSALMPFTDHNGVIINASGRPGNGKTTSLLAAASVWGHPKKYLVKGTKEGSTSNGLFRLLGIHNNLPLCLDDVTTMEPQRFADLCMNITQGQGKTKATRSGQLNTRVDKWANITMTTANVDGYAVLSTNRAGAEAEAVRLVQVAFHLPNCHTKAQADQFIQGLAENYGHAGHEYAKWLVQNKSKLEPMIKKMTAHVDKRAGITPRERFWSVAITVSVVGAMIARDHCELLKGFPIEQDLEWICGTINGLREQVRDQIAGGDDILAEFLASNVGSTVTITGDTSGNIGAKVELKPMGKLFVRHEIARGKAWVLAAAIKEYCAARGANFSEVRNELIASGVLIDDNVRKVLGQGTDYATAQARCWYIDMNRMAGKPAISSDDGIVSFMPAATASR